MNETRFVDPEQVFQEAFAGEPFQDTFIASVLVHKVCSMYPHLYKSPIPHVQLMHLIYMLLDYLAADPNQPKPLMDDE